MMRIFTRWTTAMALASLMTAPVASAAVSLSAPHGVAYDHGDAPDSYLTLVASGGAVHGLDARLRLGAFVDGEVDALPGANADGDDANATPDDEDGLVLDRVARAGLLVSFEFYVYNDTGMPANAIVWVDLNGNGVFDASEASGVITIASEGQLQRALVAFFASQTADIDTGGTTYARARISTSPLSGGAPGGTVGDGEVEDLRIEILPPGIALAISDHRATLAPGETGNYTVIVGSSALTTQTRSIGVPFDAARFDNSGITWTCVALASASCVAGQPSGTGASGSGAIAAQSFDIGSDSALVFTVNAPVRADAPPGPVTITAALDDGMTWSDTDVIVGAADYGDAPSSYHTLRESGGPSHTIASTIRLGRTVTAEYDGVPDDNASPDIGDDGVEGVEVGRVVAGTTKHVDIVVLNETGAPVTLAGWIDTDDDAQFGDNAQLASVPAEPGPQVVRLSFPIPADAAIATGGTTYARFRVGTSALDATSHRGPGGDGEVEDYRVDVVPAGFAVTLDDARQSLDAGETTQYRLDVQYSGTTAQTVAVGMPLDTLVFDIATIAWTCVANAQASCVAGQPNGTGGSGTGSIDAPGVPFAPGGALTYRIDATVRADAHVPSVTTTAIAGDATDSDVDVLNVDVPVAMALTHTTASAVQPGQWVGYRLLISEAGDETQALQVSLPFDASSFDVAAMRWFCYSSTGASCVAGAPDGTGASGFGPLPVTTVDVGTNGVLEYVFDIPVRADATPRTLTVTATTSDGASDSVQTTILAAAAGTPPVSIPMLEYGALAMLGFALMLFGFVAFKRAS